MLALVALSLGVFIAVSSAVGVRLLIRYRRTQSGSQLCVGLGFFLIGVLGYPASVVSGMGTGSIGEMLMPAYVAGTVCTNAGLGFLIAFTWITFRPLELWARSATGALLFALAADAVGAVAAVTSAPADAPSLAVTGPWTQGMQAICLLGFSWTSFEALHQYRLGRRRLSLGLSGPEVTNRFLLWAVFGLSTTIMSAVNAYVHASGQNPAQSALAHGTMVPGVVVASAAIWLAFMPPDWYLVRLRRAEAEAAARH